MSKPKKIIKNKARRNQVRWENVTPAYIRHLGVAGIKSDKLFGIVKGRIVSFEFLK